MTRAGSLAAVMSGVLLVGCTESTLIRTNPPGARLTINDRFVGVTPVMYSPPASEFRRHSRFAYRLEREGYGNEEGYLRLVPAPGRVVGAVFTLGLVAAFRPFRTFKGRYDFQLDPKPGAAAARMRHLRELLDRGDITEKEYETLLGEAPAPDSKR